MRISRPVHGIIDYLFSILVAVSPWVFGFAQEPMAPQIAVTCGALTALYSMMTDYELGILRFLPFSGHRFFDLLIGLTLAGSAWHFSMGGRAAWVFGILGVLGMLVAFVTRTPRETGTIAT